MIFVTLGTQAFPFDRLLIRLDELVMVGEIKEPMFAQIGLSSYQPKGYAFERMLTPAAFEERLRACGLLIAHGGTASLIAALRLGKKIIAVPRRKKYGEHVDDHQTEIISVFAEAGLLLRVDEMEALLPAIHASRTFSPAPFESGRGRMLELLERFIQSGGRSIS